MLPVIVWVPVAVPVVGAGVAVAVEPAEDPVLVEPVLPVEPEVAPAVGRGGRACDRRALVEDRRGVPDGVGRLEGQQEDEGEGGGDEGDGPALGEHAATPYRVDCPHLGGPS